MANVQPVTLITGASTGIGEAFARVCASDGLQLVLVSRRAEQLESVAQAIAAAGHAKPAIVAMDLAAAGATDQLAHDLSACGLEPSIVINNAGFGLRGQAAELDRAQQLAMVDLNMRVLTDLSLRWVNGMAQHGGGLINVASLASFFPGPGMAVYYATKAYVRSFTEALHAELAPRGIKVTAVCPGPVPTPFHERAGIDANRLPKLLTRSADRVAREGWDGFKRNRRVVISGSANRFVALGPRLLPSGLLLRLADKFQLQ